MYNIPKSDKKDAKTPLSFPEVKAFSTKYLLPSKVIYELYSEFNCLKTLAIDLEKKDQITNKLKKKMSNLFTNLNI